MRVLLLNQFYPPDMAPTGQLLHDLARQLLARGHEVHAVCSARSYDGGARYVSHESLDGIDVRRVPAFGFGRRGGARLAAYASFLAGLAVETWRRQPEPDVIVTLTTPPYLGLAPKVLPHLRAAVRVHWIMDLYPDVLAAHGMLAEGSVLDSALRRLTRWQLSSADLVLTLGPFMNRLVHGYVPGAPCLAWVPLWCETPHVDAHSVRRARIERGWEDQDLVLMYSGNMGLGHSFDEFLEAAGRLGPRGPLWVFLGGGARRAELESFTSRNGSARVRLLDYVSQDRLPASLAAADVHLISLRRKWQGLIVPSKLQAAFAAARPVIFVGPEENEVARWILDSGGGWVVPEGDVPALVRAVEAAGERSNRESRGRAALAYAREHFDRTTNCERIISLVERVRRGKTGDAVRHAVDAR